ncbi:hypothetical protein GJV76_13340 [Myroides sp. BIT-d1]|uniref:DUF4365 domain-containing protein n=1 Tax=Myroides albus TaxID=2562892 RepID=A0A6I3LML1_9FLAO|nr:hypothetical protein [Myroides albus]MTG99104.1 hypothetical protein [Myroides albus]
MKFYTNKLYNSMPSILFKKTRLPVPQQNTNNNIDNGNDAEILAASLLLKSIGAEISWSSRNEDSRKIDLICSYDHPWVKKERLIFFIQVKSGRKFGRIKENGFTLLASAKKAAQRTSHSICIIWIERDTNKSFWAYIHPFSTKTSQKYSNYHLITPAMRFDIARCQAKSINGISEGKGIILKKLKGDLNTKRKYALSNYKRLKSIEIFNPNLGKIEFTRIGWRHMFRKQRNSEHKEKSFTTIPYLDKILLQKPTTIYITEHLQENLNEFEYRICEYVLTYEKVKIELAGSIETINVNIRLLEEIRWPMNWLNNPMLTQMVERRVVLLNAYYK